MRSLTQKSIISASLFLTVAFTSIRSQSAFSLKSFPIASSHFHPVCGNAGTTTAIKAAGRNKDEIDRSTTGKTSPINITKNNSVKFRPGRKSDEIPITLLMTRNLMNPLNINHERFIVAVNPSNDNDIYGFVQLRPLATTSTRDPNTFDSLPGSGKASTIMKDELYDDIWDEFENEDIEFPNGFASLPWTKEYREYMKASQKRRERNEYRLREVDQLEKKERQRKRDINVSSTKGSNVDDKLLIWELASAYVLPEWRKKGIGSELIRRVMAKHVMLERQVRNIYLLTLESTKEWYTELGFEITDEPPASMKLEIAAGGIVTKLIGEKLICMRGGK